MSIVVVGSTGQLARHLRDRLPQALFLSRTDADLTDLRALERALRAARPAVIVNAAAYTAVDRAEAEPALAWSINAEAPALMARVASEFDIPLIHVSTDYVFRGDGNRAWRATDAVDPINVYGRTKLAGEIAVTSLCRRSWVLRTSWVFSEYGNNFVKTMLRLARERPELRIVNDQVGCPTYADDLARSIVTLATEARADQSCPYGVLHATGGPAVSWFEFAQAIVDVGLDKKLLASAPRVTGIPSSAYPTPAKRPANSILEPSEALGTLGIRFDWRAGLERSLDRMQQSHA